MYDASDCSSAIDRREFDTEILILCSDGDADCAAMLLGDFLDHLDVYISELARATSAREWSEGAHRIKGAARSIGAIAIAGAAAVIECAPPEEPDAAQFAINRLRYLAQRLRALHKGETIPQDA